VEKLAPEDFAEFFHSVHHPHAAFEWQKRLAREVLQDRGGWPDVIRVPTACGKTSVLDLAVFQLAMQAELDPSQRTAARRICFVVDRRLVVDEVTDHAKLIRAAVCAAAKGQRVGSVLKEVAERLAMLAAEPGELLRVVRLRGSVYRDDGWAADPLTPTIIVSTVDQVGSRLLFRGYGVGPRSSPVHAGLLAFDTRIILDEAHLSTVFASMVNRVRQYQTWATRAPVSPGRAVSIVRMSATSAASDFELLDVERRDSRLRPRLDAHKLAELVEVKVESITATTRKQQPQNARKQEKKNSEELVGKLVERARGLAGFGGASPSEAPGVIGVVVNRVATARLVFESLKEVKTGEPEHDAILLTGRIRPFDRDRLLDEWLPRIKAGRQKEPGKPLFVVATQTVEVGANLDFGALVTEAAPLDALRQRFGRLDRLGDRHNRNLPSFASVVIRSDLSKNSETDPIYGSAIADTWKLLSGKNVRNKAKQVDFGVNDLDSRLNKIGDLTRVFAPQPDAPLLFPAHLDAWVQTNPEPEPDPDVAPFLHGPDGSADVLIVWRADLNDRNKHLWKKIVALMPPRTREALPVPIYEAQRWLCNEAAGEIADIEGRDIEQESGQWNRDRPRLEALRWRGPKDPSTALVDPSAIRPGDTIVVPASYGGNDPFGWKPSSRHSLADVAEACLAQLIASYPDDAFRRPLLRFRLHPDLIPDLIKDGDVTVQSRARKLVGAAISEATHEAQDHWPAARKALLAINESVQDAARRSAIGALLEADPRPRTHPYPDHKGLTLSAYVSVALAGDQAAAPEEFEDEEPADDEASLGAKGHPVTLSKHTQAVEDMSVVFAERCGLSQFKDLIRIAAHWHDQGKRDQRFQAWLRGSEIAALGAEEPLAKSGRDPNDWGSSDAFDYPRGSRHEFVSVRLFEQENPTGDADADLIKLLIGTHHGNGRGFATVVIDKRPVDVTRLHNGRTLSVSSDHGLYRVDSGWTDLFWRMVRCYGWWGIAYLEAIIITADRLVSAREASKGRRKGAPA
jgi:CRISPR-associated endonuclease/helicase Cas3